MKKKRRNPRPERSALDSARAALERAGEEYPPVSDENAPETPETSEAENAPEQPETPVSAIADNPEMSEALENADNEEIASPANADDAEAQAPENTDDAKAEIPESTDDAEAETAGSTDDAEAQTVANTDSAEAEIPANTDSAEAETAGSTDDAEAEPVESTDNIETQSSEDTEQTAAFVQPDTAAGNVPEDVPAFSEESDDEPEAAGHADAERDWNVDYEPFPEAESDAIDTERHTMETKEITLGYQGPNADGTEANETESGKKSEKRGKKPRFSFKTFKPLNRLKAALQEYVSREKADRESDDGPPSAASKDAAIRKRVMQIEDEETRNYLLDRVLPQMTWYGRKSAQYRTTYYRLMVATIALGALIPIFSLMAHPIVPAILGVSVTAINAYLALHNYRDLWMTYQTTRETLIHTLYCYFNQAGVFAHGSLSPEDLNVLLVNVCEDTLSKELGGWTTILQKT